MSNEPKVDRLDMKDEFITHPSLSPVPVKHAKLKEVANQTRPQFEWELDNAIIIVKRWIAQQLLTILGLEKPSIWQYVTLAVVILGVLAITFSAIFPKCGNIL